MIERDDFAKRLKSHKPLSVLELFYPLMQGYDSVKIAEVYGHCDVELGGTDQTFNLLLGRELSFCMPESPKYPQIAALGPMLEFHLVQVRADYKQRFGETLNISHAKPRSNFLKQQPLLINMN